MIVIIGFITPLVLAETIDFVLDTKPSTLPAFAISAIEKLGGRLAGFHDYVIPHTDITHRVVVIDKVAPTPAGYPRRWAKIQKSPIR